MRYSIIFRCVEVVSCVLRVEICLGRAHKYFQDGVISDPVTLGRDSYPGVAGCGRSFFALSPAIMSAIFRFLPSRDDIPPAPICLYKAALNKNLQLPSRARP
jgi:hypothetical protein